MGGVLFAGQCLFSDVIWTSPFLLGIFSTRPCIFCVCHYLFLTGLDWCCAVHSFGSLFIFGTCSEEPYTLIGGHCFFSGLIWTSLFLVGALFWGHFPDSRVCLLEVSVYFLTGLGWCSSFLDVNCRSLLIVGTWLHAFWSLPAVTIVALCVHPHPGPPPLQSGGQNQKWPINGQGGYITPAASGIPSASKRGAKSEVAHKWARWLHHPCRLGDPLRFKAGGKTRSGP